MNRDAIARALIGAGVGAVMGTLLSLGGWGFWNWLMIWLGKLPTPDPLVGCFAPVIMLGLPFAANNPSAVW